MCINSYALEQALEKTHVMQLRINGSGFLWVKSYKKKTSGARHFKILK
jgi:hypothetical protein